MSDLIKCSKEGGGGTLGSDEGVERWEGLQAAPHLAMGSVLLGDHLREEGKEGGMVNQCMCVHEVWSMVNHK